MLQIAICDDVAEQTVSLQKYIVEYCSSHEIDVELHLYAGGDALLRDVQKMDIVFLDIEMPELDGIETGRKIQMINKNCKIIMATYMVERMKEAFYIEAFRFITKPFSRRETEEALASSIERIMGNKKLTMYYNWLTHKIPQREIRYIVTYDSYCEMQIKDKTFRSEESLTDLEEKLDKRLFFRIHRKYIVNMLHIRSYDNGVVYIGDIKLPVSRRRKKSFEAVFMEFDLMHR
ncbi:MAG: response regulator transcription factor [Lachnospiraceae bacterium]|nr:response regulator transcription factor [Lachnospiraceae bacterium]